jgi:hypothetical protein
LRCCSLETALLSPPLSTANPLFQVGEARVDLARQAAKPDCALIPADGITPSHCRGEELERKIVGVAKGEAGSVVGVLDAAVGNTKLIEPGLPFLELRPVRGGEGDVVETDPVLVELSGHVATGELVQAEKGIADRPDHMAEGTGVLVENGSASNSRAYQLTLTSRSRTVTATWVIGGKLIMSVTPLAVD